MVRLFSIALVLILQANAAVSLSNGWSGVQIHHLKRSFLSSAYCTSSDGPRLVYQTRQSCEAASSSHIWMDRHDALHSRLLQHRLLLQDGSTTLQHDRDTYILSLQSSATLPLRERLRIEALYKINLSHFIHSSSSLGEGGGGYYIVYTDFMTCEMMLQQEVTLIQG